MSMLWKEEFIRYIPCETDQIGASGCRLQACSTSLSNANAVLLLSVCAAMA